MRMHHIYSMTSTLHIHRGGCVTRASHMHSIYIIEHTWHILLDAYTTHKSVFMWFRAALHPRLGDWQRAQLLAYFWLLERAQIGNFLYIKWAYQIWYVSHLIGKIREVVRPCVVTVHIHHGVYIAYAPWRTCHAYMEQHMQCKSTILAVYMEGL